jgi:hypothetical protein
VSTSFRPRSPYRRRKTGFRIAISSIVVLGKPPLFVYDLDLLVEHSTGKPTDGQMEAEDRGLGWLTGSDERFDFAKSRAARDVKPISFFAFYAPCTGSVRRYVLS